MSRVLIVEDDDNTGEALVGLTRKAGFDPTLATTGSQAIERLGRVEPDIVLLDLDLPDMPGTEVCKEIRRRADVPVIMVTGYEEEIDRVVGFELGVDDYVTKPYSARELVLRIRAVLRRATAVRAPEPAAEVLAAGPVTLDLFRHAVTVDGEEVHVPLKEFELLEHLVRNSGRALPRSQLIEHVWGKGYFGDTKTLDVHIRRLRAKMEPDPRSPRYLVNVRGLGFKFTA